jgi:hypothetical protein
VDSIEKSPKHVGGKEMNVVLADRYVHEHTEELLAAAAKARLVRQARGIRRRRNRATEDH